VVRLSSSSHVVRPLTLAVLGRPRRLAVTASRRALLGISVATVAAAATTRAAQAQGILVQGIADAEAWKTDSGSILLTRNGGRPSFLGRMHLWGAAGVGRHVVVYAAGTAETGDARNESGTEWYTELAGVRYTRSDAFVIDAGKIQPVIGTFAARRYSTRNPLIGMPDGYPLQYPLGVQASGTRGRFDYRAPSSRCRRITRRTHPIRRRRRAPHLARDSHRLRVLASARRRRGVRISTRISRPPCSRVAHGGRTASESTRPMCS
jgi:hypothetical protein